MFGHEENALRLDSQAAGSLQCGMSLGKMDSGAEQFLVLRIRSPWCADCVEAKFAIRVPSFSGGLFVWFLLPFVV